MDRNWFTKKLGEVCISDLGKTLNQSKDEGEMYPYLCSINVLWDKIDLSTLKQTRFKVEELEKYSVRKGDLLICEGGDIGRAAIWDKDETILYQNALHRVRFNDEVLPRYCLLYLRHLKENGVLDSRYGKGVTIKHLVKSSLLSIPIPIPPLPEQSRIVEELDQLSNIIEKKRQQLSELDNLAQSIFYDMFGDPVTNEKGWEVKPIVELYELKAGKAIKANELHNYYGEGLYRCYGGNGIRGYIAKCSHSGIYPIIGRQGALCGNVNLAKGDFYATEHAVVVSSKENNDMIWTYYCMSIMNLNKYAKGVAQPGISVNVINGVNIIHPSFHLQQLFAQKIEAIEKEKVLIKQSIKETEELFNSRMDYYFI